MWEIQPDWTQLASFYVSLGGKRYQINRQDNNVTCSDNSVLVSTIQNRSFTIQTSDNQQCTFIAPKRLLRIHNGEPINCVDLATDGSEIISGDSKGKLFLTHIGTDPVPLIGPTEGFDIEDVLIDRNHKLLFSCGGDFRIYEFSSTEYQPTGRYDGHKSSVKCIRVRNDNLYSGSYDSTIARWDIKSHRKVTTMQMNSQINEICFTNNGLIVAATEKLLRSVDEKTGLPAAAPNFGKSAAFNSIATFNDEIVAGTNDGEVALWDLRNTDAPLSVWQWFDSPINKLKYSNGKIWCMTNDGTAACINVKEKKAVTVLGTQAYAPVRDAAFNDEAIWTADGEGLLSLFEL